MRTSVIFFSFLLSAALGLAGCSRSNIESVKLMNEGVQLAQNERLIESAEALQKSTSIDPSNALAYWNLAIVQMQMKKYNAARDSLKLAIQIDGKPSYYQKLGTIHMELKEWDQAKAAFEKAAEANPKFFKSFYKLGQVYERMDKPQEALTQYTKAVQAGPRFMPAYSQLGRLYAALELYPQAAQVLQSALKVAHPGSEDAALIHHLLGTVYQQEEKYDQAIAEFKAALDIDPQMGETLFSLGWTYSLTKDTEEAKRFLTKFIESAGNKTPGHYVTAAKNRMSELDTRL